MEPVQSEDFTFVVLAKPDDAVLVGAVLGLVALAVLIGVWLRRRKTSA